MKKLERLFFKFSLWRRERRIGNDFDSALSREIDCLLALLEGGK